MLGCGRYSQHSVGLWSSDDEVSALRGGDGREVISGEKGVERDLKFLQALDVCEEHLVAALRLLREMVVSAWGNERGERSAGRR